MTRYYPLSHTFLPFCFRVEMFLVTRRKFCIMAVTNHSPYTKFLSIHNVLMDYLEFAGNFRRSIKTKHSCTFYGLSVISDIPNCIFRPYHYTWDSHQCPNSFLWLVPSHFQQIKMFIREFSLCFPYSAYFCASSVSMCLWRKVHHMWKVWTVLNDILKKSLKEKCDLNTHRFILYRNFRILTMKHCRLRQLFGPL